MRTIDVEQRKLTGWGRAVSARCTTIDADADQIPEVLQTVGRRGAIARGLGRSYGDAAQNSGGEVIRLRRTPVRPDEPSISLNEDSGGATVTANAAVSFAELIDFLVPRGYFVPVTPGTRLVTLGGAIASDIHGKNHHLDGSLGHHVRSLRLATSDGDVLHLSPDANPELFWATIGGMGLTGIVVDATIGVLPVETSRMQVTSQRLGNLGAVMDAMVASDRDYRYSVAWIDVLARGPHLGRGVLTNGTHAQTADLGASDRRSPLRYWADELASFPRAVPPGGVINRTTVTAFNEAWYRLAPTTPTTKIETISNYFHPLDAIRSWNRAYGRRGFLQYQVVVPSDRADVIEDIISSMSAARLPSFLTVLKRFGPANPAPLSFPMAGWTLAVDVSTRMSGLEPLLRSLDDRVLDAGGRHYLAKDHLITPAQFRRGYPRLAEWRTVRDRHDQTRTWTSDLNRRLGLVSDEAFDHETTKRSLR